MIVNNKVWGKQMKVFDTPNFEVWRIEIKKGGFCSRHIHRHKFNMFFVENGKLKILVHKRDSNLVDETILYAGDQTIVEPSQEHMFLALEDTIAFEFYWVELGEDIVRRVPGGMMKVEDCIFTKRYYRVKVRHREKEFQYANIIYELFNPKKIFHAGCDVGNYLLTFKKCGCDVRGCDKYYEKVKTFASKEIVDHIYSHNVIDRFNTEEEYDLLLSLDIAEHISPNDSQNFVRNMTEIANNYIIFTSSNNVKGRGHINCRDKNFWIVLFASFGFHRDKGKEKELVNRIQKIGDPLKLTNNLLVFKNSRIK